MYLPDRAVPALGMYPEVDKRHNFYLLNGGETFPWNDHIFNTFHRLDELDHEEVRIILDEPGGAEFARLTGETTGGYLAIVIDGMVFSAPRVISRIDGGRFSISLPNREHNNEMILWAAILGSYLRMPVEIVSVVKK